MIEGSQGQEAAAAGFQPAPPTDLELITRIAERDRTAIEMFYDRHAARALGLAVRILNDREAGEDVVQEAFWRVWDRISGFDTQRGQPVSWLLSIVHHLAIDEVRRRQSRPATHDLHPESPELLDLPDFGQDVYASVLATLDGASVRAALIELPKAQREVIELAYFGGYTRQEIATHLAQPLGTIHTRARLGLARLKQLLTRSEEGTNRH